MRQCLEPRRRYSCAIAASTSSSWVVGVTFGITCRTTPFGVDHERRPRVAPVGAPVASTSRPTRRSAPRRAWSASASSVKPRSYFSANFRDLRDRVGRDPEHDRAGALVVAHDGRGRRRPASCSRACPPGVEVEDDGLAAQVGEVTGVAVLVGEREVGGAVPGSIIGPDPAPTGGPATVLRRRRATSRPNAPSGTSMPHTTAGLESCRAARRATGSRQNAAASNACARPRARGPPAPAQRAEQRPGEEPTDDVAKVGVRKRHEIARESPERRRLPTGSASARSSPPARRR